MTDFERLVENMRQWQRTCARTCAQSAAEKTRRLEREVDRRLASMHRDELSFAPQGKEAAR